MNAKPLIIVGAGGHAKVVLDTALSLGHKVLGMVDANSALHGARRVVVTRAVL